MKTHAETRRRGEKMEGRACESVKLSFGQALGQADSQARPSSPRLV
ncbi:MAG: hypothetical protein OXS32_02945 [Verrucomicrobiales bacterium]|nr:hypothetical protein [Verrucomicrobiales bacterium]